MYQFKNVLIPTDFGPAAWNAVKFALTMCGNNQGIITLLHVYPSNAKFDSRAKKFNEEEKDEMDRIKKKMKSFTEELIKGRELNLDSVILKGWVDEAIQDFIKKNDFDLIIMGVNSNGFDNRMGSHISKIIEKTSAPLMVIPNTLSKVAVSV